jgi:hypothetical protein
MAALGAALLLAACGGGGGDGPGQPPTGGPGQPNPPATPTIARFDGDSVVPIGGRAQLTAVFSGGSGRIEPDIGPVASGVPVATRALDRSITYRLVVESATAPAVARSLTVEVRFRDQFRGVPGAYAASQQAVVATGDGRVLLMGGSRGGGVLSSAIDRYDPRTGAIEPIGQMAQGRGQPQAVRLPDARVLVAGGAVSSGDARSAELVDERSGLAVPAGRLSVPRIDHTMTLLPDGRVLVTGGYAAGEGASIGISRSAEIWEPTTGAFRRLVQTMRIGRAAHAATALGDGRVLISGGYSDDTGYVFAEIFDARDESFTPLDTRLPQRANHAAHQTPDGRVLLLGGETLAAGSNEPQPLAEVVRFEPASGRFTVLPPLAQPRTLAASVALPGGEVLLFGGQSGVATRTRSAESYHPERGGRAIAALDVQRVYHGATRLPDGRILVVGGEVEGLAYATQALIYE